MHIKTWNKRCINKWIYILKRWINFIINPPPLWNSTYCGWFVLCTNLMHVYFRYCSKASLIDFMALELLPEINWKLIDFDIIAHSRIMDLVERSATELFAKNSSILCIWQVRLKPTLKRRSVSTELSQKSSITDARLRSRYASVI